MIRRASLEDAPELLKIYAPYVEKTAISFEWETPDISDFTQRMEHIMQKYPYLVAEVDGKTVGYAYAGSFKGRAAYDWDVEVTIYTDQTKQKQGLGRMLYEALESALAAQHILNVNACITVPPGGLADEYASNNSKEFHAHMGYQMVGTFTKCGYKFGRWYDMTWMEKHIGSHDTKPHPVVAFPDVDWQWESH